jgi:predicted Rdx family selenoprotein
VEATFQVGHSGIFKVEVDGKVVAQRSAQGFPSTEEIVEAVAKALPR